MEIEQMLSGDSLEGEASSNGEESQELSNDTAKEETETGGDVGEQSAGQSPDAKPAPSAGGVTKQDTDHDDHEDKHPVPRKALLEERRRRQEAERKIAKYEGMEQAYSQMHAGGNKEPVEDPTDKFYADPVKYIADAQSSFEKRLETQRVAMSAQMARSQFKDYDDLLPEFFEAAKSNPDLERQMLAAPSPALFAYETAKNIAAQRELGATSVADIEARVRAKVEEEYRQKYSNGAQAGPVAEVNRSTAGVRGSSPGKAVSSGDSSMRDILGR